MIKFKYEHGKKGSRNVMDSDLPSRLQGPASSLRAAGFSKRKLVLKAFSSSAHCHDNCF